MTEFLQCFGAVSWTKQGPPRLGVFKETKPVKLKLRVVVIAVVCEAWKASSLLRLGILSCSHFTHRVMCRLYCAPVWLRC